MQISDCILSTVFIDLVRLWIAYHQKIVGVINNVKKITYNLHITQM